MNELKTIKLQQPEIEFNFNDIDNELQENLKKYEGLTFTEDTAKECKSTIAELRKGKKAVDEYRKKTKKELSEPIKEFEEQCKLLNSKFDEVLNPLIEQHDQFEEKRKQEKMNELQAELEKVKGKSGLEEKFANQLEIQKEHLAKSRSVKSVVDEWKMIIQQLELQQNNEHLEKENIVSAIGEANRNYGVSFSEAPYFNLIGIKDVQSIKQQIMDDAQNEVDKQQRAEEARKEAEEAQKNEEEKAKEPEPIPEPVEDDLPFTDDLPFDEYLSEPVTAINYQVAATVDQHEKIKTFLNEIGVDWSAKHE